LHNILEETCQNEKKILPVFNEILHVLKTTLVYNYKRIQIFKAGTEIEFARFEVMNFPVLGLSLSWI